MIAHDILNGIWYDMRRYEGRTGEKPVYAVMHYRTRDKLRTDSQWSNENYASRIERVFGLKILIDEDLADDWVEVVGAAR